jgi:hypothetical protein
VNSKRPLALALAGPLFALGACQDGGDLDTTELAGRTGTLISASADGATICFDKNESFGCDVGEASTIADASGHYALDALFADGRVPSSATVIAVLERGSEDTEDSSRTLLALRGHPELISGVTNLAHHLTLGEHGKSADEAWSSIKSAYGVEQSTDLLAPEAYANDARLGRLASYLESYGRVSSKVGQSSEQRSLAIQGALSSAEATKAFFAALESTPQAGLTTLSETVSAPSSDNFTNMAFTQGMKFGAGWDDVRSSVMGNTDCLEPFTITSNKNFTEKFYMRRIKDKSDLTDQLDISGKITLDLDTFDATIEGQYFKLMETKQNDVYILARLEMTLRDFHIQNPVMSFDGYGNCLKDQEDANGRCPGVNGAPGLLNNKYGTQVGTIRNNFVRADPEPFRKKCGDRYINTITAGGAYYAMLVVHTSSEQEKQHIGASLEASIKQFEIEGKLDMLFNQLAEKENTEITIMKRGNGGGSMVVVTPEQFDTDVATFKTSMCSVYPKGCESNEDPSTVYDWTKAPFRVKFESFEPTAKEIFHGGDVAADREAMDIFVYYANQYRELQDRINNMLQTPIYYVGVYGREAELQQRIQDLNHQMTVVRELYAQCNKEISRTCVNLNENGMMDHYGLRSVSVLEGADAEKGWDKLPIVKLRYPKSCAEFKEIYQSEDDDGEKLLYMGGDKAKKFFMYCDGMTTNAPVDYLSLPHYDPASATPVDNFSQFVGLPGVDGGSSTLTTVYERLKVLVNGSSLKLDLDHQDKFRTSVGAPVIDPATNVVYKDAPYATAKSCLPDVAVHGNLNLLDTPFVLTSSVTFSVPEKQFEFVAQPANWLQASEDATTRGGRLAFLEDENDNKMFARALTQAGAGQAWLGLMSNRRLRGYFDWYPAASSSYRNFANPDTSWLGSDENKRIDFCAAMRPDGKWEAPFCRTVTNPYFVQYRKVVASADEIIDEGDSNQHPGDRQVFDLSIGSKLGNCGTLSPTAQPSLRYSPEKAALVPDLNL